METVIGFYDGKTKAHTRVKYTNGHLRILHMINGGLLNAVSLNDEQIEELYSFLKQIVENNDEK